jgi:hypothetical protein
MRDKRSKRNKRKIDALPKALPPPFPVIKRTPVINHVSATIMDTKELSKTNHASRKPFRFNLKAPKRIDHSQKK